MSLQSEKCEAWVPGDGRGGWSCSKNAVVREAEKMSGKVKGWCRVHSPSYQAKKDKAWREKFDAQREMQKRAWNREEAQEELMRWAVVAHLGTGSFHLPDEAKRIVKKFLDNGEPSE